VVVHSIEGMKLEFLTAVQPVDLFLKEGEDVRRVTYRLTFQHPDRALAHDEVDGWMASVITHLQEQAKVSLAG
jgi:phenylalanyl-tRNA synthetase beta subunit